MTEERVFYTRRCILGLAAGIVVAGCAGARSNGSTPASPNAFPSAQRWCWHPNTATPLDTLGKLIMKDRNPYCLTPADPGNAEKCEDPKTETWPQALTNETTWKFLTQFDFQPNPSGQPVQRWPFSNAVQAQVTRSMRIPYLIKHSKAKKKHVANLGGENLLVGYEPRTDPPVNPMDWPAPDNSCAHNESIGTLADFITENMVRDGDKFPMSVGNWNAAPPAGEFETGLSSSTTWYFRRAPIVVDYSFRFPVASRSASTPPRGGWIYIGYEGGGAY